MSDTTELYETDYARWAEGQARVLRDAAETGMNLPLDWYNLAEEVEGLARSDRRALKSRIETILEHLLKLACSTAADPRAGWESTVRRERNEIEDLLEENRSFRGEVAGIILALSARVVDRVAKDIDSRGEVLAAAAVKLHQARLSEQDVLGDWFPSDPLR